MPTAKKLPSGSWRCRVFSHRDSTGKKIYKSFTCDDVTIKGKRKCEAMATAWSIEKKQLQHGDVTFAEAVDLFLKSRENVLSVTTIAGYRSIADNHLERIGHICLSSITQEDIQKEINTAALHLSPKTVRNIHGLISAVLATYRPDMPLHTALPQKKRPELSIPTDTDIHIVMELAKGTDLELPVLLAAFGTMRRGEICALTTADIHGDIVHIGKSMALTRDNQWIIKTPKTYSSDRYVQLPHDVIDLMYKQADEDGRITKYNPNALTHAFRLFLKQNHLKPFRFHDFRHYSVSTLHAAGIPDAYIMQRGGWATDHTLKAVYRHILADKTAEMNQRAIEHFSSLYDTKYDTK